MDLRLRPLVLSAVQAMDHPYFEMFKQVGHDRLAAPPPVMTKEDFSWESEKTLTKANLRQILYEEIGQYHLRCKLGHRNLNRLEFGHTIGLPILRAMELHRYHPEMLLGAGAGGSRFAPTASNDLRQQFSALSRGDDPHRGSRSTSMPAEQVTISRCVLCDFASATSIL